VQLERKVLMAVLEERFLDGEVPVLVGKGETNDGWVVVVAPMYDGTTSVMLASCDGEPPAAMDGELDIYVTLEVAESIVQKLCEDGGVVYPHRHQ
jgi:hypothetical protein